MEDKRLSVSASAACNASMDVQVASGDDCATDSKLVLLSCDQLLRLVVMATESDILPEIPPGDKSNKRFMVDNSVAIQRRKNNQRRGLFSDDCGPWSSKLSNTSKTSYVMTDDYQLHTVKLKNGSYCQPKKQNKKIFWIPMDPQPEPTRVVHSYRSYRSHKLDINFKKRITWFEFSGPEHHYAEVAIVEYSGQCPPLDGSEGHEDASVQEILSSRTKSSRGLIQHLKNKVKRPRNIVTDLCDAADIDLNPEDPDLNVVANAQQHHLDDSPSLASEIVQVFSMVNSHPYVQETVCAKGKPLSIVLYTAEQLADLKTFISSRSGRFIRIDKTVNAGVCFVTAVVHQNMKVIRNVTRDHPTLLGPVFLHSDTTQSTYHIFLAHMQRILDGLSAVELNVGNDAEAPLVKATNTLFPSSTLYICDYESLIQRIGIGQQSNLPDLIEAIYREVKMQMADLKRCLVGQGKYSLCPSYRTFLVPLLTWSAKSEEEKDQFFQTFLSSRVTAPQQINQVTSVDLAIPQVSSM